VPGEHVQRRAELPVEVVNPATIANFSARFSRFSAASRRSAALRSLARSSYTSVTGRRERV
jgi:hypothetical protein